MHEDDNVRLIIKRLDDLAVITQKGFIAVEERFAGVDGRFVVIDERLDKLAAEMRAGFARVDRRFGTIETRLELLETKSGT